MKLWHIQRMQRLVDSGFSLERAQKNLGRHLTPEEIAKLYAEVKTGRHQVRVRGVAEGAPHGGPVELAPETAPAPPAAPEAPAVPAPAPVKPKKARHG